MTYFMLLAKGTSFELNLREQKTTYYHGCDTY